MRYGLTTLPGFIVPRGSQMVLNCRNASTSSGPNIFDRNCAFDCPSPCSPDSDPPYDTTSELASSMNALYFSMPGADSRSKSIRVWMQPCPKWPYSAHAY